MKTPTFILTWLLVLSFLFVTVNSCNKESSQPSIQVIPEKTDVFPREIILLNTNYDFTADFYDGKVGEIIVRFNCQGKNLSFMVPALPKGQTTGKLTIDSKEYQFTINILEEPFIGDVNTFFLNIDSINARNLNILYSRMDTMIAHGLIDPVKANADKQILQENHAEALNAFANLTQAEKEDLARYIAANKGWMDEIDDFLDLYSSLNYKSSQECEDLLDSAKVNMERGNNFTSIYYSISAITCEKVEYGKLKENFQKAREYIFPNVYPNALLILVDQIGRTIENMNLEFQETSEKRGTSTEIIYINWKKSSFTFINGQITPLSAQISFRSVGTEDIGEQDINGIYVDSFQSYEDLLYFFFGLFDKPFYLIPTLNSSTSEVIAYNRNLSIPTSGITNSKVYLLTQQYNGDVWEVIFATDETTDQDFSFDLVYSDGDTTLTKTFDAVVSVTPVYSAYSIEILSGNNQAGIMGQSLAQPIQVIVKDIDGNPFSGTIVNIAADNGGSVSQTQVATSADGIASVTWTLGVLYHFFNPQAVTVTAYKSDNTTPLQGSPLTFIAYIRPAVPIVTTDSISSDGGVWCTLVNYDITWCQILDACINISSGPIQCTAELFSGPVYCVSFAGPLEPNTTYYVRAHAMNNAGEEAYGNVLSFTTPP